jgi:hypothetical protein
MHGKGGRALYGYYLLQGLNLTNIFHESFTDVVERIPQFIDEVQTWLITKVLMNMLKFTKR